MAGSLLQKIESIRAEKDLLQRDLDLARANQAAAVAMAKHEVMQQMVGSKTFATPGSNDSFRQLNSNHD